MQPSNRIRNILAALCIVLAAAALIGATVWTPSHIAPDVSPWIAGQEAPRTSAAAKTESTAPMVGTFTGEFENGVPVYRLPAIAVTVSRSVELAKMAREEQLARR